MRTPTLCGLVASLLVGGCQTWKAADQSAEVVIGRQHPDRVRLSLLSEGTIVLAAPKVRGDTIRGWDEEAHKQIKIPADSVSGVEVRATDAFLTARGVVAGVALAFATMIIFFIPYTPGLF